MVMVRVRVRVRVRVERLGIGLGLWLELGPASASSRKQLSGEKAGMQMGTYLVRGDNEVTVERRRACRWALT